MFVKKNNRRALLLSVMSLILCCAMLVGTTFAWFTDEVKTGSNIIKSGNLDVTLEYKEKYTDSTWTDATNGAIFNSDLWEPGYTQVRYVKIANKGNLALKFQLNILPTVAPAAGEKNLADVIDVYMVSEPTADLERSLTGATKVGTLSDLINDADGAAYGVMEAPTETEASEITYGIALQMQTSAGNEYQGLSIGGDAGFAIQLLATQHTSEADSFDNQYDYLAAYPGEGKVQLPAGAAGVNVPVENSDGQKIGAAEVPAAAIADSTKPVEAKMAESSYQPNFTIADGLTKKTLDISVENLKEGNTTPVKVTIAVEPGKNPNTFKLYHYDTEIPCTYDPVTGYVTFEATSFSPFTVVYDAESEYVPPVAEESDLPKATVGESTEYENVDLPWGSYGQWSPTEGLDSQLEAAYTFTCAETLEEAKANPYAQWYCDFYVKLDRDLGANQIFLGGNYGSFGWVGFHNGELTLEANTEIPLIGSVAGSWTYLDVVQNVRSFICGVGDVDDALSGATFTVMLRLTNPENEAEFYNVATINYTFE